MTLESFWYQHADAAGAALIVAVLAVVALCAVIRRYERLARAQRTVYRTRLAAEREELHARYRPLIAALAKRKPTFEEDVTQAVAHTKPLPYQPLADSYVNQTIDEGAGYAPVFWDGRVSR